MRIAANIFRISNNIVYSFNFVDFRLNDKWGKKLQWPSNKGHASIQAFNDVKGTLSSVMLQHQFSALPEGHYLCDASARGSNGVRGHILLHGELKEWIDEVSNALCPLWLQSVICQGIFHIFHGLMRCNVLWSDRYRRLGDVYCTLFLKLKKMCFEGTLGPTSRSRYHHEPEEQHQHFDHHDRPYSHNIPRLHS
jgi:hypothetical protein